MSKFDFDYMRNDELEVMCYNKNKWTKEEALKKSKVELNTDAELEVFDGYVSYGFYANEDGDVYNGWHCSSFSDSSRNKNSVDVWLVLEKTI